MERRELPEGWEWKKLGDITHEFISGGTPSTKVSKFWEGDIPWTTSASINGFLLDKGERFISNEALEKSATKIVPKKNVLIATRVGIGKATVNLIDIAISQDITGLVLKKGIILPEFLVHYLHSKKVIISLERNARGTTIKGLQRSDINQLPVPLPPLPVQHRIVKLLEQANALRHLRAQADAETQKLLQSVFYEMFGDPVRNEKKWETKSFDKIALIKDVDHRMPPEVEYGVPLISPKNFIANDQIDFNNSKKISEEEYTRMCRKIQPQVGDIIFSRYGTICEARLVPNDKKFQISYSLCIIRPTTDQISLKFLFWSLKMPFVKQEISRKQRSSCIPDLGLGELNKIKISLPPLVLQEQFAIMAQNIEQIRDLQMISRQEIERLIEGLMAKAFAGELN